MHRFFLSPEQCRSGVLVLTGHEAHHGLHVLRLRPGEVVSVLDGAGQEFSCEVQRCERDQVRLGVLEKRSVPALPYQVTLLQAVPKGKIIESIIQKATELGAARVVPLLSERVVLRLAPGEAGQKAEKWQGVAVEAVKQCGSAWLPRVEAPVTPLEFLARREQFELSLVGSLQADATHPRQYFGAFERERGRKPASVAVWVGPEGDFTIEELRAIQAAGAHPISLGRLVLRSETAAIYCLSMVNYELQAPRAKEGC